MRSLDSVCMPPQIAALERDERGYPIPFFVARPEGRPPDLRFSDVTKPLACHRTGVCWVCGRPRDGLTGQAFVLGPMATINRVTTEGPCHEECAAYSALVCPALNGEMVRRTRKATDGVILAPPGGAEELPQVVCVYVCRSYHVETYAGHLYFRLGKCLRTTWFAAGLRLPGGPGREVMEQAARMIRETNAGRHLPRR